MTDTTGGYPPLDGLVVLDLSRVLAGPYAAMLLGDPGARVIKVERPEAGDDTIWRRFAPLVGEALAGRDAEEWLRLVDEHGIPAGEIKEPRPGLLQRPGHLSGPHLRGRASEAGRDTPARIPDPVREEHGEESRQWAKTSEPTEAASDHRAGG